MTPASDRDEAQRRRGEARRQRRDAAQAGDGGQAEQPVEAAPEAEQVELPAETSHDTLMQAVKAAAAGAAVGVAAGAARAITSRDGSHEAGEQRPDDEEPGDRSAEAADLPPGADERAPGEALGRDAGAEETDQIGASPSEPPDDAADAEPPRDVADAEPSEPARREPDPEPVAGGTLDETTEVVRRAREQLAALRGHEPESVSSLERTPTGWTATFEVVELARVPDSTDVLASYEVVLDEQKNVTRYARVRRYYRSQAEREGGA